MRLIEQFKKEGDFLFRWRSYLPLVIVPFMVLVVFSFGSPLFSNDKYNTALIIIALVVGIAGQVVRIFVAGFAPKDTSGRNTEEQKALTLNTSGIYSLCRNPLYLGNFLMMLSPVILVGNWIFMGLFMLGFWLYYERIICAEEVFLSQKFGESYTNWCNLTPCFIPRFRHYQKSALSFSLKSTLRREYHSLFGLASSLLATNLIITAITQIALGEGQMPLPNCILAVFFALCLVIYVICRILVKKTDTLCVENR